MKKILHINNIFCLVALLALFSACEKEITLEQKEVPQKLAVLCNFSPDEPFSIQLSKSQSLRAGNSPNNIIENANVEICADNVIMERINPTMMSPSDAGTKFMSEQVVPMIQKTYTLKIDVDGVESITATSTIPNAVQISHATVGQIDVFETDEFETTGYEVRAAITLEDKENEENFYQVNFYQELLSFGNSVGQDPIKTIVPSYGFASIDPLLTNNFNRIDQGVLFKDLMFNGTTKELLFEPIFYFDQGESEPINIIMELRTVSKEYYQYYTSVYRQTSQTNVPFSDPTIIFSNINNGYGIFAGYSKDQVVTPVEF